jgi:hypothetical protein
VTWRRIPLPLGFILPPWPSASYARKAAFAPAGPSRRQRIRIRVFHGLTLCRVWSPIRLSRGMGPGGVLSTRGQSLPCRLPIRSLSPRPDLRRYFSIFFLPLRLSSHGAPPLPPGRALPETRLALRAPGAKGSGGGLIARQAYISRSGRCEGFPDKESRRIPGPT